MNLIKRLRTLWILSGWDVKSSKKEGSFTFDGIIRPQNPVEEKPAMAQIIKRSDPISKALEENNE